VSNEGRPGKTSGRGLQHFRVQMKVSQTSKQLAQDFAQSGFTAKILVDENGDPVFAWAWAKDIVVTKIELTEKKK
jgi:hypothetical protein